MAIDDPVEIVLQQAREDVDAGSALPTRLVRLGMSATAAAAALANFPFVSQIMTTLLAFSSVRFEKRFLRVAEELEAQQKRIEEAIPDKSYYESEEFQTLIALVLERLHTTHDSEKLKMFGDALANAGTAEFKTDDKEMFIRVLRDLSAKDLEILNNEKLKGWLPHLHKIEYGADVLSSLSRLSGFGLVIEKLHTKRPSSGTSGSPHIDAIRQMEELLTSPPRRAYHLSPFGERFLKFITAGQIQGSDNHG